MMIRSDSELKIAVIGSGISGIAAAYLLQRNHHVTIYEKNDYFGGHTNTIIIPDGPDAGTPVDTGFIVLNQRTYPNFIRFLDQLGVNKQPTDMSFSYYCKKTGLQYASRNLNSLFAQRMNVLKPTYWRFLYEMVRFIKSLRRDYLSNRLGDITLGQYFAQEGYHQEVIRQFVIPMAAAIWSGSDMSMNDFPIRTFAQFYENHGLLAVSNHPPWFFVESGSHSYVKAFLNGFNGETIKNAEIHCIQRFEDEIKIKFKDGTEISYDAVVMATHADQVLQLLDDPTEKESSLLSPWKYSRNKTILHTDESVMPPNKNAWASWNYVREIGSADTSPVTVTYDMNRLQKLNTHKNYFVTLNPKQPIPDEHVIRTIEYEHPQYSFDAFSTQNALQEINGQRNTFFCGAYFGYGFHEDGVKSALAVAKHFGLEL